MVQRGKLAISFIQLVKACSYCFSVKYNQKVWPDQQIYGKSIFCLSVRTGLDLTLLSMDLSSGDEILVTNINIPDMFTIFDAHGLKCKPIPLNKYTLGLSVDVLEKSITPKTKAILITHLFGAIMELESIIAFAKKYNLIVIEDCAQAFDFNYRGNPASDVALFSFGLIKTNTCLTGGLMCFNNENLFNKVNTLNDQRPKQKTEKFGFKVLKAMVIKLITLKWIYTLLYAVTKMLKKDFDSVLARFTKGFPGENVLHKIRFRPCDANLRLLENRTHKINSSILEKRKILAEKIIKTFPEQARIGQLATKHSHWVIPIASENPAQLITEFRKKGIDATSKASSLISIKTTENIADELTLETLVYIPIDEKVLRMMNVK